LLINSTKGERISTVKRTIRATLSIFTAITLFSCTVSLSPVQGATANSARDEGFRVKEYSDFHDVLEPLQHEALPNNDFKTIRSKAGLLWALGQQILKLGVPKGVEEKKSEDFNEALKKFGEALAKFKTDAGDGTDDELKVSYSAVHDSFEVLAAMLPRK
jgi:hypothetical protein